MAGRYKVTTNSIRNLIIEHFKNGKNIRTIGKRVRVSHSTVFAIIKRWKLRGTGENALKSRAPHKLTALCGIMHSVSCISHLQVSSLLGDLGRLSWL
ncbi:hypothetical protein AVEN_137357-1 [Araneus ventricosus]|uniref:Paired domain-containing protein n=1 Tax=Araneus ventricosus TaxID=182803 RepID=A0A4Y2G6R9_ARAVE|nr:hypothetical protein AVEN_137357-1 [Araneus ventricosus]